MLPEEVISLEIHLEDCFPAYNSRSRVRFSCCPTTAQTVLSSTLRKRTPEEIALSVTVTDKDGELCDGLKPGRLRSFD